MNSDDCNLTWQFHSELLTDMLQFIQSSNTFADVTLVCEDQKKIKAHKIILSASSPIFRNILSSRNDEHTTVHLSEIKSSELEQIIQFIYLGQTSIDSDRIDEFFSAAKYLDIKEILGQDAFKLFKILKKTKQDDKNNVQIDYGNDYENDFSEILSTDLFQYDDMGTEHLIEEKNSEKLIQAQEEDQNNEKNIHLIEEKDSENLNQDQEENLSVGVMKCDNVLAINRSFPTRLKLREHTKDFYIQTISEIICQLCSENFGGENKKDNLNLHLFRSHGIENDCNIDLKDIHETHKPSMRKQCQKCEKSFNSSTGLLLHMKAIHWDENYKCRICDFKTPQRLNLEKHMVSKHGLDTDGNKLDPTLKCAICEESFIAKYMLKNHVVRKHTEKENMKFRCSLCDYTTVENAALQKHNRFKHSYERPFLCDTCEHRTHTASALARHKRGHLSVKPFKCDICGAQYADRKRLRDHIYIHAGFKPFKCKCNSSFTRKELLKIHQKKCMMVLH